MALNPLENPLERLKFLPTTMNWRGGWLATEQYYLNDVVVSPVNVASYILVGKTALLGGGDPTTNPDWVELSNTATGVLQVNAGIGLVNTGTPTIVDLENTGIITITAGNAGIGVVDGSGPPYPLNTVISNNGVLSVAAGNAGIAVSAPTGAITVSNNGILGITAGTGLSSTGGQTPTLSVSSSGLPKLSIATVYSISGTAMTPDPAPQGVVGVLPFVLVSPLNAFGTDLATGVADPNGTWILDLTKWTFAITGVQAGATFNTAYAFVDTTTVGGPYTYNPAYGAYIRNFISATLPFDFNLGQCEFVIPTARATGMRTIDEIHVLNNSGADMEFKCAGDVLCSYYANGVV
jgi:hypothetical protein